MKEDNERQKGAHELCQLPISFIIYLQSCGTTLKETSAAAARETLPIVAAKLESTAQGGTVPVSSITGPPKMSNSWLIRGAAQYFEKMREETVGEKKRVLMKSANNPPHCPCSLTSLGKGRPTYT